jgi:hypothetical protein
MRTRTLAALLLLVTACTTSDKLILTHDDAATPSTGGTGGGPGTAGEGGGSPADAAVTPDAPAMSSPDLGADLRSHEDVIVPGDATGALSCAELPACGPGLECFCCPLGLRISHCTCSVACTNDAECPATAPHCNVKKVMGIPLGKGFCTEAAFFCAW